MTVPCHRCNDTGITIERREGTDYPTPCRSCDRFDPAFHSRADLYRAMRFMDCEPPIVCYE